MTLKTICQDAAGEIGFPVPSSIVGNNDETAQQLFRFAKKEGDLLSREKSWQVLVKETSFTLSSGDQDYALASDFRYLLNSTVWNRSDERPVILPLTSKRWQFYQGTAWVTGLNLRARLRNDQIEFQQTIGSSDDGKSIYYEYLSKYWCEDGAGNQQETFAADTDVSLIDERLITMGVIWRFKKAKGLEYQTDIAEYRREVNRAKGYDGAAMTLSLNGAMGGRGVLGANIPDQGYG